MSIRISNLTKIYGNQKAVNAISFVAPDNEIVGFLGPNGAGKSTTMKMITGFLQADSGTISVNGIDVNKQSLQAKQKIGYLPEGNPLYVEMYVREYLQFIADVHQIKNTKVRIEEVISLTGLQKESNKKIKQLSKGYKQRVGLAAALIHDPEVLILDEPTSGLDPNQIIEIRQVVKDLGKNKTVLFSSHILQEVESICDRVVIIHKGEIVANDSLQNLQSLHQSEQIVMVQFAKEVSLDDLSVLENVEKVEMQNGIYSIYTHQPEKIKKLLLEYSLQNNLDILSLQSKNKSLEEVFSNLTST